MIRKSRFALDSSTFANERKEVLASAEERLTGPAKTSLVRVGLSGWYDLLLDAMLSVFDSTVKMETPEESPIITDMRNEFKREMGESMAKAKKSDNPEAQQLAMIRWAATASVNAAVEAAAAADPDENVGVEWVTMEDADVRESHKELHGAQVPTGQTFEVDGENLLYPGQPVGDPAAWYNCRCILRPAMLGESAAFTVQSGEFSNASDPTEQGDDPSTVLVALPREGDPVLSVASGDHPHTTLVYLGKADPEGILPEMEAVAKLIPNLMTDRVSGRATLGDDKADVLLLDASATSVIRKSLMDSPIIDQLYKESEADQFPHWIPHTTIGYPEAPALSDEMPTDVTYDRIALWRGEEMHEVKFSFDDEQEAAAEPESIVAAAAKEGDPQVIHAEDEEFTQEMADELVNSVDAHVPWHGVLAPENTPSGDGRKFAEKALVSRNLPIPLKWMPADQEGHDGSVIVGRIDRIFRDGNLVKAEGVFDVSENAYEAVRQIANSMLSGVSVDLDDMTWSEEPEIMENGNASAVCTSGRIAAATLCAIPAYAEAFIALGGWPEEEAVTAAGEAPGLNKDGAPPKCEYCEETAEGYVLHSEGMAFVPFCAEHKDRAIADAESCTPGEQPDPGNVDKVASYSLGEFDIAPVKTRDGKGWITDPTPTQRITGYWVDGRGAAKIGWGVPGDFSRCESQLRKYVKNPKWLAGLCANLHYRALGVWPGREGGKNSAEPLTAAAEPVSLVAAGSNLLSADYFRNPNLDRPTPITITEDGHLFGHVAAWGVCHISFKDTCTTAPRSRSNYAYYQTGEVLTDAGPVAVGQVTMDGPHAPIKASASRAAAHYDQTCSAVADVAAGEDAHGIWVSGKIRDGVTDKQLHDLRASALSGDWRRIRGGLEMVAALAVNVPGFPIPRASLAASGEGQTSLVAAQIVTQDYAGIDHIPAVVASGPSDQDKLSAVIRSRSVFKSITADRARAAFK